MAKHRSHKKRAHSKAKTMRHSQHGGALAGNPPSAWGWGMGTVGNGWTQFLNSLTLQPGQNLGTIQSNDIVPVGNINAQDTQGMIGPNLKGEIPTQSAGKRIVNRKKHKHSSKRGGNIGTVLGQAAVPGALMAGLFSMDSRKRKHH